MTKQKLGPNQRKWLKALESGKFKQAKSVLRRSDDRFCCLGVACELFKPKSLTPVLGKMNRDRYEYRGEATNAPAFVMRALSLRDDCGGSDDLNGDALTEMNDAGKSFQQIAQIVKADPSLYFKRTK